jgi:NADH dehydrogenase
MTRNVVILGGGFGGMNVARRLERVILPTAARVTLVNDVNFMLYAPLLPGAAGGVIEPRHVVVPLREVLKRTDLRVAYATGADPQSKRVFVRRPDGRESELAYDQLVVALGSTSRTFPIPGLKEHAVGFKTLSEGIALRNRLVETLETAETVDDDDTRRALLTYVVVGAGYAGLEGAGRAAGLCPRGGRSLSPLPPARPALHAGGGARAGDDRDRPRARGVRHHRAAPARDRDPHEDHGRARER